MNEILVTIENTKYEAMVKACAKLEMIEKIAEADNESYGYNSATSKAIDIILGIERDEK